MTSNTGPTARDPELTCICFLGPTVAVACPIHHPEYHAAPDPAPVGEAALRTTDALRTAVAMASVSFDGDPFYAIDAGLVQDTEHGDAVIEAARAALAARPAPSGDADAAWADGYWPVLTEIRGHDEAAGTLPRWGNRPVGRAANEAEHDRRWLLTIIEAALRAVAPSDGAGGLREALDRVMRNVVCGTWYDDPANDPGSAAVNRLHDAEREMWRLYDEFGIDPGDAYIRRPAGWRSDSEPTP